MALLLLMLMLLLLLFLLLMLLLLLLMLLLLFLLLMLLVLLVLLFLGGELTAGCCSEEAGRAAIGLPPIPLSGSVSGCVSQKKGRFSI